MLSDVRSVNIKRKVCLRINEISNPHKILIVDSTYYIISHLTFIKNTNSILFLTTFQVLSLLQLLFPPLKVKINGILICNFETTGPYKQLVKDISVKKRRKCSLFHYGCRKRHNSGHKTAYK